MNRTLSLSFYLMLTIWAMLPVSVHTQTIPLSCATRPTAETNLDMLRAGYDRYVKRKTNVLGGYAEAQISVVVHIVRSPGTEFPSVLDITAGLNRLNAALAGQPFCNGDPGFEDSGIRLCLAARDGLGKATTGVLNYTSKLSMVNSCTDDGLLKSLPESNGYIFPDNDYLNIYLVDKICAPCISAGCRVGGYAKMPVAGGTLANDGVVLLLNAWISPECGSAKTALHEIGHYFGLLHTFDGGCTNGDCLADGDGVCDTPPTNDEGGLDYHPCTNGKPLNTCHTDVNTADSNNPITTDLPDASDNIMSYAPAGCIHTLTPGQLLRMRFGLEVLRPSLLHSLGCYDPCNKQLTVDATVPDTVEAGKNYTYINTGTSGINYLWTINTAKNEHSNSRDLSYTFDTTGTYTLNLTVDDKNPGCRITKTWRIVVICGVKADFTYDPPTAATGDTIHLTRTSPDDMGVVYKWIPEAVQSTSGTTAILPLDGEGSYQVGLEGCDQVCCSRTVRWLQSGICEGPTDIRTWYFGSTEMKFNADTIRTSFNPNIKSAEGSAAAYDEKGNLLFFFSGDTVVWDKNFEPMDNGNFLKANTSSAQMLTLRQPGSPNLWWLFYPEGAHFDDNGSGIYDVKLYYAVIDMNENGGLGRVVTRDQLLTKYSSERITAVRHCNGRDWWIVTHPPGADFLVYALGLNGLNLTPVTSAPDIPFGQKETIGVVKASGDGTVLALTTYGDNGSLELYHFDRTSGRVSDPLVLEKNVSNAYGVEFSQSGQFLYFSHKLDNEANLYQYDISRYDVTAIKSTKYQLQKLSSFVSLQRASDQRIYFVVPPLRMYKINYPDRKGNAAEVVMNPITTYGVFSGLPAFPNDINEPGGNLDISGPASICRGDTATYTVTGGCPGSGFISNAIPGATIDLTRPGQIRLIPADTGRYYLAVRRDSSCLTRTDTLWIVSKYCPSTCTIPFAISESHTTLCHGDSAYIRLSSAADSVFMELPDGRLARIGSDLVYLGSPLHDTCYRLRLSSVTLCDTTITVCVSVSAPSISVHIPDTVVCRTAIIPVGIYTDAPWVEWYNARGKLLYAGAPGEIQAGPFALGDDTCFVARAITASGCDTSIQVCLHLAPSAPWRWTTSDTLLCAGETGAVSLLIPSGSAILRDNNNKIIGAGHTFSGLLPGAYRLSVFTEGYCPDSVVFTVRAAEPWAFNYTREDSVVCSRETSVWAFNVSPSATVFDITDGGKIPVSGGVIRYERLDRDTCFTLLVRNEGGCDTTIYRCVQVEPSPLTEDTLYACPGDSVLISGKWRYTAGDYEERYPWGRCDSVIRVSLRYHPAIAVTKIRTPDCFGDSLAMGRIEILAGEGPFSIDWTNARISGFEPHNLYPGTFGFRIKDGHGCGWNDTLRIDDQPPLTLSLPEDKIVKESVPFVLDPHYTGSGPMRFSWIPPDGLDCSDCPSPTARLTEDIIYTLEVTDSRGCSRSAQINIHVIPEETVYVPNAFTPNSDGNNDIFEPYFSDRDKFDLIAFEVYNRWGGLVYQCAQEPCGWDGNINGQPANSGVYVYRMIFKDLGSGKTEEYQGNITLIR